MNDIEAPQFYDAQNIDELIANLHRAGLYNLSQLVKNQFEAIANHESEIEDAVEAANDQSYQSGFEDGQQAAREYNGGESEAYASWFLNIFAPEDRKNTRLNSSHW